MICWSLKTRGLRPIGLDIGHNSIKMIQLAINGEQISVLAADETRIDSSVNGDEQARRNFAISAIERMLDRGNFQTRNVVSCIPSGKLKITSLRLAEAQADGIEQALRKEVVQRFGLDPEKDAMDYVIAGSVRQGNDVKNELILLATDHDTIKNHIETIEQAGLKPVAIDTIPCALFRSFERSLRRHEDWDCTSVFVDVGGRFTTVVFGRGGQISFIKQIPIGGEHFIQQVAAKLDISAGEAEMLRKKLRVEKASSGPKTNDKSASDRHKLDTSTQQVMVNAISAVAEDLAREISLCLRYYTVTFRGKRVRRAAFAGGGAYEDILLDVLRRELAVEVEVAQPLKGFDLSSKSVNINSSGDRRGLLCEWAVAAGLSLKGWNEVESDKNKAKTQVAR
jgi:type IV pilus assembly protein PilM